MPAARPVSARFVTFLEAELVLDEATLEPRLLLWFDDAGDTRRSALPIACARDLRDQCADALARLDADRAAGDDGP
jgi:hypothetical protein